MADAGWVALPITSDIFKAETIDCAVVVGECGFGLPASVLN
jgi:hypothetical protein